MMMSLLVVMVIIYSIEKIVKPPVLEQAFTFLKLAFTDIEIKENNFLKCLIQNL